MATKKKPPTVTTTANYIEDEGAVPTAPSTLVDDPAIIPTEAELKSEEEQEQTWAEMMVTNGFRRMIALMNFPCYGGGNRNYILDKGNEVWVHEENVQAMLRSQVVRSPKEGE
jgi:hypothetical protein